MILVMMIMMFLILLDHNDKKFMILPIKPSFSSSDPDPDPDEDVQGEPPLTPSAQRARRSSVFGEISFVKSLENHH